MMKKVWLIALFVGQLTGKCFAFDAFKVNRIEIEGNQRLSTDAVLQELPIQPGQQVDADKAKEIVHELVDSGFFKEVALERDAGTLIIKVTERPSIGKFTLKGLRNSDELKKIIQSNNLVEGRTFEPTALAQAEKEIELHYLAKGRYGVKVESQVVPQDRNRVAVALSVYEGDVARIRSINIVGNQAFSAKVLKKELYHQQPNWLSWLTKSDRYSKEKLKADQEKLRTYYLDRGYVNFDIESTQVSLSPDKKSVFITFNVVEGQPYYFGAISVDQDAEADKIISTEATQKKVHETIAQGAVFSRRLLWEVQKNLQSDWGNQGFSQADIRVNTDIDEQTRVVTVQFIVVPKGRVLVRRVVFEGNNLTEDTVLRRCVEQHESAWIATDKIQEGKDAIRRAGYASEVDIETLPVTGKSNVVDIKYKVKEQRNGHFTAGVSYSGAQHFMFNLGADIKNFLGTGRNVDFTFDKSKSLERYSLGYFNPYFTEEGLGMGYRVYKNRTNLSKTSRVFNYALDTVGAELTWQLRVTKYSNLRFGVGYDRALLKMEASEAPQEAIAFSQHYDNDLSFQEYTAHAAWLHNSLDALLFPTRGVSQSLSLKASLPSSRLKYYQVDYDLNVFAPIKGDFVLNARTSIGYAGTYGNTRFPFFRHYYAGGDETVRGYEERSLGPRSSHNDPFGGNLFMLGRVQTLFPPPFFEGAKNVRLALFLDAGQVYDTHDKRGLNGRSRNPNGLRYSVGVSISWNTPLQIPLVFSFAKPLQKRDGDDLKPIGFSLGTQF